MGLLKMYQCKYCGVRISKSLGVPLKTKCPKRKPAGLHVWVRIK